MKMNYEDNIIFQNFFIHGLNTSIEVIMYTKNDLRKLINLLQKYNSFCPNLTIYLKDSSLLLDTINDINNYYSTTDIFNLLIIVNDFNENINFELLSYYLSKYGNINIFLDISKEISEKEFKWFQYCAKIFLNVDLTKNLNNFIQFNMIRQEDWLLKSSLLTKIYLKEFNFFELSEREKNNYLHLLYKTFLVKLKVCNYNISDFLDRYGVKNFIFNIHAERKIIFCIDFKNNTIIPNADLKDSFFYGGYLNDNFDLKIEETFNTFLNIAISNLSDRVGCNYCPYKDICLKDDILLRLKKNGDLAIPDKNYCDFQKIKNDFIADKFLDFIIRQGELKNE